MRIRLPWSPKKSPVPRDASSELQTETSTPTLIDDNYKHISANDIPADLRILSLLHSDSDINLFDSRLKSLAEALRTDLGATALTIWIADHARSEFRPAYTTIEPSFISELPISVPIESTRAGACATSGVPIWYKELDSSPEPCSKALLQSLGLVGMLALPLIDSRLTHAGSVIAVAIATYPHMSEPRKHCISLERIASIAASVLLDSFSSDAALILEDLATIAVSSSRRSPTAFDYMTRKIATTLGFGSCSLMMADDSVQALRIIGTTSIDTHLPRREWIILYRQLGLSRSDSIPESLFQSSDFQDIVSQTLSEPSGSTTTDRPVLAPIVSNVEGMRKLVGLLRLRDKVPLNGKPRLSTALDTVRASRMARLLAPLCVLAQSRQQRDVLLMNVRHEINTPATIIRNSINMTAGISDKIILDLQGLLQQLLMLEQNRTISPKTLIQHCRSATHLAHFLREAKDELRDIEANAEVLLLVGNMLEVFTDKPLQPQPSRVLIMHAVINPCVSSLRPMAKREGLKDISVEANVEDVPHMLVDKSMLMLALYNVIKNAIKYSNKGTTVHVRVSRAEIDQRPVVQIDVENTGIGVEEQFAERIFDPYFRTETAMGKWVSGTGIGLSVARQLANLNRGDVVLKKLNHPTVFSVHIEI